MAGRVNHRGWVVVESIGSDDRDLCVDFFEHPAGGVGFEHFRADPEDRGRWTAVGGFAAGPYGTLDAAARAALRAIPWLGQVRAQASLQRMITPEPSSSRPHGVSATVVERRGDIPKRVLIAGLGDAGLLVAIDLARSFDVVGVSPKPCLVSGQELGMRLARPEEWKRDFLIGFERYRALDRARIVHGRVVRIDPGARTARIAHADGHESEEAYDALVLSPGVTNGFWRNAAVEDLDSVERGIRDASGTAALARTIAVVGGGASGVSAALNLASALPERAVHLFFGQELPLPAYHSRVRVRVARMLLESGVALHPGHRGSVPEGFGLDGFTMGPLCFSTGQAEFDADLTLWAIGRTRPNTGFIPPEMLDAEGFIRTDPRLRVPGHPDVFAVGDAAATDPHRSSARNLAHRIVARNVRALLSGRESAMKTFEAPAHRWGSILGVQPDGLRIFDSRGRVTRLPRWFVDRVLFPVVVRRAMYRGIRPPAGE